MCAKHPITHGVPHAYLISSASTIRAISVLVLMQFVYPALQLINKSWFASHRLRIGNLAKGLREPNSDEPAASKARTLGVLALPAPMVGRQHLVTLHVDNQPPHSIPIHI